MIGYTSKIKFIFLILLFCFNACSIRYFNYNKAVKKVKNNELTIEEFDEKYYAFYNSFDTLFQIKCSGSFVNQDIDGKYRVYKFFPNGKLISTWKMDSYPNNLSVLKVTTEHHYYRIKNNKIEIEYLQARDWKLYNIIKQGRISEDTIVFYQTKNMQIPWAKARKINSVYIYDANLTNLK